MTAPRYVQAADAVRERIADGTLKPGSAALSGEALARATGFSVQTCRRAIRDLITAGVLEPGASPYARPRVAGDPDAARQRGEELSAALAGRRLAAGLTQAGLAAVTGYSAATITDAETGRLWQARKFWECADRTLRAGGELLRLYEACRAPAPPDGEAPGVT